MQRQRYDPLERIMRQGTAQASESVLARSAETLIHDFFRDHSNHFDDLERSAEELRARIGGAARCRPACWCRE